MANFHLVCVKKWTFNPANTFYAKKVPRARINSHHQCMFTKFECEHYITYGMFAVKLCILPRLSVASFALAVELCDPSARFHTAHA